MAACLRREGEGSRVRVALDELGRGQPSLLVYKRRTEGRGGGGEESTYRYPEAS